MTCLITCCFLGMKLSNAQRSSRFERPDGNHRLEANNLAVVPESINDPIVTTDVWKDEDIDSVTYLFETVLTTGLVLPSGTIPTLFVIAVGVMSRDCNDDDELLIGGEVYAADNLARSLASIPYAKLTASLTATFIFCKCNAFSAKERGN